MKRRSFRFLSLVTLVALLALAACAAPASAPPAAPAAPAPQAGCHLGNPAPAPTTAPAASWRASLRLQGRPDQPSDRRCGSLRPEHEERHRAGAGRHQRRRRRQRHPVEVIYEDDRLNAADAQTAFLKLVQSDKVPVIMGSGSSSLSLSLCPKAQEMKIVQISSISTAP